MGLDFSHADAHWSYGGFMRFRERLAGEAGITLRDMAGFATMADNGKQLPWDAIDDPIKSLLNHSDCDGDLSPDECKEVAPRLRELVKGWPDDDYDKIHALMLAKGMELAASQKEKLRFG